jgi:hypothetical protein
MISPIIPALIFIGLAVIAYICIVTHKGMNEERETEQ